MHKFAWSSLGIILAVALFCLPDSVLAWTPDTFGCPTDSVVCQGSFPATIPTGGAYNWNGQTFILGDGVISGFGFVLGDSAESVNKYYFKLVRIDDLSHPLVSASYEFAFDITKPSLIVATFGPVVVASGTYFAGFFPASGAVAPYAGGSTDDPYQYGYCAIGNGYQNLITSITLPCRNVDDDTAFYVIGTATGSGWLTPPAPPEIICDSGDYVCRFAQYISTSFQNIIQWLFIPSGQSFNQFTNLWEVVKLKPPLGYFTTAKNAFEGITTASGSYYLTFSGLDSGNSPLKVLKTGLIWVLWLMLGFWILHRIRQLEI